MSDPEPTGWCWGCGLVVARGEAFHDAKCHRRWDRDLEASERRMVTQGKRAGYGAMG